MESKNYPNKTTNNELVKSENSLVVVAKVAIYVKEMKMRNGVNARLRLSGRNRRSLFWATVLLESVGEPGRSHVSLLLLN